MAWSQIGTNQFLESVDIRLEPNEQIDVIKKKKKKNELK